MKMTKMEKMTILMMRILMMRMMVWTIIRTGDSKEGLNSIESWVNVLRISIIFEKDNGIIYVPCILCVLLHGIAICDKF